MTDLKQQAVIVIVSLIGAVAIIVAALVAKGTVYENIWLYITGLLIVLLPALDWYFKKKNKGQ